MYPFLTCERARLFCLLFIVIQFSLISSLSLAQKPQHLREGVFRIKVSEGMARQLEKSSLKKNAASVVSTGIESVDALNKRFNVVGMKRVFPHAGKFEAKHRKYGLHRWYEVQIDKGMAVAKAMPGFKSLTECEFVEPVYEKTVVGSNNPAFGPINVPAKSSAPLPGISNDPMLQNQWHYHNVGQTGGTPGADIKLLEAWRIQTGSPDVIVAVEDGGIDLSHEDLAANLWVNSDEIPGNGLDDDNNGYVDDYNGYSFVDHTGNILAHDHGTHVAGTVAAVSNNNIGVAGVAGGSGAGDGVRLMSCAVFSYWGGADGFAQAYAYAADNGAVISQNSWTYTAPGYVEQAVLDGIDYFTAEAGKDEFGNQVGPMNGGLVIFAAANFNSNDNYFPASYPPVLSVASTNHHDQKSWYSNYGTWVDIAAPGGETNITQEGVLSTLPNNQYGYYQGTSMACPHVSGVAALVVSQFGNTGFDSQLLRARLLQATDNIDAVNPQYVGMLGVGRINAYTALAVDDEAGPLAITDLAFVSKDITTITLGWTAPADETTGSAAFYNLRYSTQPIDSSNFNSLPQISFPANEAGQWENYTVTGLAAATTYYFAIKSYDVFGNGSLISNVVSETTAFPPVISIAPTSIDVNLLTAGSTTVPIAIANNGQGLLQFTIPDTNSSGHVVPSVNAGSVNPGESTDVDLTLTASYLLAGTYEYQLQVNSNDPVTPIVIVPVTIRVTNNGFPIAYVTHNNLQFGQVTSGRSKKLGFTIANEGSEPLTVTGLLSGSGAFTTDLAADMPIAPFQTVLVNVTFTPDATGLFEGSLTLQMNDPVLNEHVVSLSGEGVEGPKLVASVSDLSFTMHKNHLSSQIITINNEGQSKLYWKLRERATADSVSSNILPPQPTASIDPTSVMKSKVRVLIITPGSYQWDLYFLLSQYPDIQLSLLNGDFSWITLGYLSYFDVVMTTNNFQWSNSNTDAATIGNLLADYIDLGGKVIVNQLAYDPTPGFRLEGRFISENYGPFTQATSSVNSFVNMGTIGQPGHPILQGVNHLQYNGNISQVSLIDESTRIANWDNGEVFLALNQNVLGVNILPAFGDGSRADWAGDLGQIYYNAFTYLADKGLDYLSISPPSGELNPGEQTSFEVRFDSKGLEIGDYQTSIVIQSNDANNSVITIPVFLKVLPEQFSHTPDSILTTLVRGETTMHTIVVSNDGNSSHQFTVDVEPDGIQASIALTKRQGFDVARSAARRVDVAQLTKVLTNRLANERLDFKNIIMPLSVGEPSVSNTVYATDFEDYALGDLNQNGWYSYNQSWTVSDSFPFSGNKHLRFAGRPEDAFGFALAPFTANGKSGFSTLSMKLKIDGRSGDITVHPVSVSGPGLAELTFGEYGIFAYVRSGYENEVIRVFVPVERPEGYFDLTMQFNEVTGEFTVYFNDVSVFKGLGFPGHVASAFFSAFGSPNDEGVTADVDDFQIIDGKKYDNTPSYISVSPREGVIAPGESVELTVTLNADSVQQGTYAADISFLADQDAIVIPTILEVLASQLVANPESVQIELPPGEKASSFVDLENHGQSDITFNITAVDNSLDSALLTQSKIGIQNGSFGKIDAGQLTRLGEKLKTLRTRERMQPNDITELGKLITLSPATATEYATNFEEFEKGLANQFGWTSSEFYIDTVSAFSGDKHLQGISSTTSAVYIASPTIAQATSPVASISMKVKFSELTNNTQFIDFYGHSGFFGELRYTDTGKVLMTTAHGSTEIEFEFETPTRYFEIGLEYSTITGQYSLYLDGKKVGEGLGYSKDIASVIITQSGNSDGMIMNIDDFQMKEGRLYESPDYLTISPVAGVIPAGGSTRIQIDVDSKWLSEGYYTSDILISDGFGQFAVPTSISILEPQFVVKPGYVYAQVERGESTSHTLMLENLRIGTYPFEIRVQNNGIASAVLKMNKEGGQPQGTSVNVSQFESLTRNIENIKNGNNGLRETAPSVPVPASQQTTYATTFEEFQFGFLNQNSWASLGPWDVTSDSPYSGEKHIQLNLVPGGESLGITTSPYITSGSGGSTRLSMQVNFEGPAVTRYLMAYSTDTQTPSFGLIFNSNNQVNVFAPNLPEIHYNFPTDYFELSYEIEEPTGYAKIFVNDSLIFEGQAFSGLVNYLSVYVSNEVNANSITRLDNVQITQIGLNSPGYLQVSPAFGALAAGESSEVNLMFNSEALQTGDYFADVIFKIGGKDRIIVPTQLNVYGYPEIAVNPTMFDVTVDYKSQSNQNFNIANTGGQDLYFSIYVEDVNATAQTSAKSPVSKFSVNDERVMRKLRDDNRQSKSAQETKTGSIKIMSGVDLLREDFESGVPTSGWSIESTVSGGPQWNTASHFGEGNYSYYGEAATVSSDAFGSSPLGTALVSPVMSKNGYNNIMVQYNANYQNYGNRDFLDLDIRVDGGQWINVIRWNEDHGSFRGYGEYVNYWIDGYLTNASTFQLRWHYYDTNPGAWDWYAQIDNVLVTGQSIPWLTLSQQWGYVAPDAALDINALFDGTQLEKGQFQKNIKVYNNSINNAALDVPVAFKVNGPAIMAIAPDTVKARVYRSTKSQSPLTITNTGEGTLNYNFMDFASTNSLKNNVSRIYSESYVVDKNAKDTRIGHPVLVGQGGPDAGGYSWKDSDQLGGPVFNWQEIRNTGTYVPLGDDNSQTVPMPFAFKFYKNFYNSVTIGSNGYLTFGSYGGSLGNSEFPNAYEPNNVIAAHWDDLYPPAGGSVHYQAFSDRFIVQYTNVPYWGNSSLPNTFQIILYLNGNITLQYLDMNNISSASTGIENSTGTVGLQVAFNTNYIHDNHAIAISNYTAPAWIKPEPASGSVSAGASATVDLLFDTETLEPGEYNTTLAIASSDYYNPMRDLPVQLSVFDNYAPVIDSLPALRVVETQSANLVLTAHDDDDSNVNITLLNPPAFVSLLNSGNGTATYSVRPSFGKAGQYNLTVNAVDSRGLSSTRNILLTVVPYGVESFSLIDKRSGQVLTTFSESITLNKADVNYPYYLIRANTNPATVGSVQFYINGAKKKGSAAPPYLLSENELKSIKVGNHTLKATAFTQKSNKGQVGKSAQTTLTIINQKTQSTTTVTSTNISVAPNPVETEMKINVTSEFDGNAELVILDSFGVPVFRTTVNSAELKDYTVDMRTFNNGFYYIQITNPNGNRSTTRVIKK